MATDVGGAAQVGLGAASSGCAILPARGGGGGDGGDGGPKHLYSFELQLHSIARWKGAPPDGGAVRLACRLWDFPTLFVDCTSTYDVGYPSLVEKGKACLFEADPLALSAALPLPLQCILFDERGPARRHILASCTLPIGEGQRAASLAAALHRYELPLNDPYGAPLCEITVSLDLRCVGPYPKRHHPPYQTPMKTKTLPPADARPAEEATVGGFFRQEVTQQLAAVAQLARVYEGLDGVTVGGCCARSAVARSVFDHQVSLLQQLQHNTQKLAALAEEEHVRQYGVAYAPARGAPGSPQRPADGAAGVDAAGESPPRPRRRRMVRINPDGEVVPPPARAPGGRRRKRLEAQRVFDAYLSREYVGVHASLYITVAAAAAAGAAAAAFRSPTPRPASPLSDAKGQQGAPAAPAASPPAARPAAAAPAAPVLMSPDDAVEYTSDFGDDDDDAPAPDVKGQPDEAIDEEVCSEFSEP